MSLKNVLWVTGWAIWALNAWAGGRVLLVTSYSPADPWTSQLIQGVQMGIGADAQLETLSLNAESPSNRVAAQRAILDKLERMKPSVVIMADDDAQEVVVKPFLNLEQAPDFVFCGVNADPAEYGYPAQNVTGILERNKVIESLALLRQLAPEATRLAVLTDDSRTSTALLKYLKTQVLPITAVAYYQPHTFEEWQAAVQEIPMNANACMLLLCNTVRKASASEENMPPDEILAWTLKELHLPSASVFSTPIQAGALCGDAESAEEHGMEAARVALEILNGRTPAEIPVSTARGSMVMINEKTAQQLSLEIPPRLLQTADKLVQ